MKKGFTLIELLAVIVILGIIAVITTPLIMGVIEDARKNSAIQSVNGLLEAGEQYQIKGMMDGTIKNEIDLTSNDLDIKGSKPESGTLLIDTEGNMSIIAKYGDYCIEKKFLDEKPSIIESEECEIAQSELEAMNILKSPTFESKTVSENEVTLTYTTEEEQNKIYETVCYYGKTESSMSNKVVADDTNCKLPVEAGYAKVCHISNSGMESCSEPKHLADYLILDGKMMVEFTTQVTTGYEDNLNQITYTENNGYLTLNIDDLSATSHPRFGFMTVQPIDLTNYIYLYVDLDVKMNNGSVSSSPDFGYLFSDKNILDDMSSFYANGIIIRGLDVPENWSESKERKTYLSMLNSINESGNFYLWRNMCVANVTANVYNIWLQLSN